MNQVPWNSWQKKDLSLGHLSNAGGNGAKPKTKTTWKSAASQPKGSQQHQDDHQDPQQLLQKKKPHYQDMQDQGLNKLSDTATFPRKTNVKRPKMPKLVLHSSKEQKKLDQVTSGPCCPSFSVPNATNPWKQLAPPKEVPLDESLLENKVSKLPKQGITPQKHGLKDSQRSTLNFTQLTRLADDCTEASETARKFTEKSAFVECLESSKNNLDHIELIIVALGVFCQKNGPTLFHNSFIRIVSNMVDKGTFSELSNVIMQLPKSRSSNMGSKEERLDRFITSIARLITEMLTILPAFSCNALGKNFIEDLLAMDGIPSVHTINVKNSFEALFDVKDRLEHAWKQNSSNAAITEVSINYRSQLRAQREEVLFSLEPPDDFRTLSIVPNREDLSSEYEPFLRPIRKKGSYPDVEAYLDIQFRLLREDFFCPMREGLTSYREKIKNKSKQQIRVDNVRIYHEVKILDYDVRKNVYTLEFSVKTLKRVNWEGSKRLLFGSLLLLTVDNFDSFIIFTVAERKPDLLAKGIIQAFYEGETLPSYATKNVMVMAESSVFFEAYRSVLIALQRKSPAHFPMEDYILCKNTCPVPPKYLMAANQPIYDLRPVHPAFFSKPAKTISQGNQPATQIGIPTFVEQRLAKASIFDPDVRPQPEMLCLDPSQSEALYAALTQKLAIIQGPPGTGKTYLGLKIVQTLLQNKKYWAGSSKQPILAICYTNHALDQFLEGILQFSQKIVRIGSQSKCKALEPYNLREWKKQAALRKMGSQFNRRWFYEARSRMAAVQRDWQKYKKALKSVETSALVHEDALFALGILSQSVYQKLNSIKTEQHRTTISGKSAIAYWLGINSIQSLERLIKTLQPTPGKQQEPSGLSRQASDEALNEEEDEDWEKEEIDEIQEQRMQSDYLYERISTPQDPASNDENDFSDPDFPLSFAISVSTFAEKIFELGNLLTQLEGDDVEIVQRQMKETEKIQNLFCRLMQVLLPPLDKARIKNLLEGDIHRISIVERWNIYACWRAQVQDILESKIAEKEKNYRQAENELKDVDTLETAEVIKDADVIGITTTGAAKQRSLLEHLRSKIVIVEEAAEVLEAHIVTSLSASCEHLILIGDHQQLRPSTNVFKLAKDFHLGISLFERLISNGLEPCVLKLQHRMRPEIAGLIVPSIYPHLENHQSVLNYPEIRGVRGNLFFLEHTQKESGDMSDNDSRSKVNPYEAEMALALAKHLLLQEYDPSKITILTTYSGQLFHLRKLRRQMNLLKDVRITVVDNFQGEENDIIILSLVRSNKEASIGFLKIDNRICVALSRAKHGFFLLGNMENLQAGSKQWKQISKTLKTNRQIGSRFLLRCEVHDVLLEAARPVDFPPEGGCFNKCLSNMPCGHICPRLCHAEDRSHLDQKCRQKCTRSCSVGHPCPKLCFQDCNPCLTKVPKVMPCSHTQQMPCYKDPADEFCLTPVVKKLPICEHQKEMDCGRDPSEVQCTDACGMLLNCQHNCDRTCHKKTSHEKLPCTQPCKRLCPADHLCPKKCFEDCGECLVDVKKKLPCGHEGTLKCWVSPKDAYCNVKVEKILPHCSHTAELDCSVSPEQYRCTRNCGKLMCNEGHICSKRCYESCGQCFVRVERKLDCGHTAKVECYVATKAIRCKTLRTVVLPSCGHRVDVPCWEAENAKCPMPCDIRLECGHQCTLHCHANDDPEHANYFCNKPCGRKRKGCKENHKCSKKCKDECDFCSIKVTRTLPCGHTAVVQCGQNDNEIFCPELVTKKTTQCGHETRIACSTTPQRNSCQAPCQTVLNCGHKCAKKCREVCSSLDCSEPIKLNIMGICGHNVVVQCNDFRSKGSPKNEEIPALSVNCPEPCRTLLPCEHRCQGTCGGCSNARLHVTCREKCGRRLICGHNCDVDCASSCPPCKKTCEYRCKHTKCSKKCSEPCSDCLEPCDWKCVHFKCTRKCGDLCNRPECNEPCPKKLSCGHPCIGLCGEICPQLCKICNKDELTEFVLYGYEEDEDARFVFLVDCNHSIEVNGLDHWMNMEQNTDETKEIQMKCCPRCKTIIRSSFRYGNILKRTLKDIILVKEKLLNTRSSSKEFADELNPKIRKAIEKNNKLILELKDSEVIRFIEQGLKKISAPLFPKKKQNKPVYPSIDNDTRYMLQVQLDVIDSVLEMLGNAAKVKPNAPGNVSQHFPSLPSKVTRLHVEMNPILLRDLLGRTMRLLTSLLDRDRFGSQEHQSYIAEVLRLDFLRAFYILKSAPNFENMSRSILMAPLNQLDKLLIRNTRILNESEKREIKSLLETVGERLNTGLGISERERQEIIRAVGLSKGHWFKCPNGHVYAIGECGGAMQESKCYECGAGIGGTSHTLRQDNLLASEMDGATYAAYSEIANNLGNFHFGF